MSDDSKSTPEARKLVAESLLLIEELSQEVRTISHLLHPPLLDEIGLASALRWYLEGFTERSKIKVEFELADDFGRLCRDVETAIFRIVQECLTNIHRHSGSPSARVCIGRKDEQVLVEVTDQGRGLAPRSQRAMESGARIGVGIGGMRERLRQIGGSLEITSSQAGTTVKARLPLTRAKTTVSMESRSDPAVLKP
ncbi:MAG: hypothetical protein JO266_11355 [Acidobacteria bacterium]|nr:hypothetical protein [Acidobacteriota bacterium]